MELNFDKQSFADLLALAKGERSINRYGTDCGVDPGYLSRLLRTMIDTAPSAMVIKKLANLAANGVTVQDLLFAAGYIDSPSSSSSENINPERMRDCDEMKAWEKVIEEAAQYNISPEAATELIRTLGKSMEKIKKGQKG